jgi:pSer/pThr/pTyr-binding forkhead associated (FHA) protein
VEVTLVAVKADGGQRAAPMKRARVVVGRKPECDIRIPVASVSREHCEIRIENGKVLVKDLGSSNGTWVNRERVQESELPAGALLGVGPAVFVIRINGEPADIDARQAAAQGAAPEPVAAARAPASRPTTPGSATAKTKMLSKPNDLEDSSLTGFDFSFLDDDDDKKQPRL